MFRLDRVEYHTFLSHRLREPVVVDLGANTAEGFTRAMLERYGATLYAVEPNADLVARWPHNPRLIPIVAAISDAEGNANFQIEADSTTSRLASSADAGTTVQIPARTLPGILAEHRIAHVDLLKVDIEGAEVRLFDALPSDVLDRIDQIAIEFHNDAGITTAAETRRVIDKLRRHGFDGVRFAWNDTDWLFYRRDRCGLSAAEAWWLRTVTRPYRLVVRNVRRRLGLPA